MGYFGTPGYYSTTYTPYYSPYLSDVTRMFESMAIIVFAVWGIALLLSFIAYIVGSMGLYRLAKNRNCTLPIMAWLPVLSSWTLGEIVDNESLSKTGVKKSWRIVLISLNIVTSLIGVIIVFLYFSLITKVISTSTMYYATYEMLDNLMMSLTSTSMIIMLVILVGSIVSFVYSVCSFICYYKIFNATVPSSAVWMIILSILIPIALPFCVYSCSKKDPAAYGGGYSGSFDTYDL